PDQNLGEMVGVNMTKLNKSSISDLVSATFIEDGGTLVGISPSERIESKIWEKGLYEGEDFDFLNLGTKWIEGCYCLPNAALKKALEGLTRNYRHVLMDSPAGLEHLNRRIASRVDDIFDVVDPSKKSFEHVRRAYKVVEDVKIEFKNFYVIGGYRFPKDLVGEIVKETGLNFLGKVEYDEEVGEYVLGGKSLLEIPSTSPAYMSVEEIMGKGGYR
ncbi:MAG: cobalamin biosynthesis protein, partial [Candidatus Bathyarchaeota archaeon]